MRPTLAVVMMLASACGSDASNLPDAAASIDAPPGAPDAALDPPDAPPVDARLPGCFALHFDGTTQRVQVPHAASLAGGGPITVEAWVRPSAGVVNPPWHPNLIGKRNDNTVYPTWGLGLSDTLRLYSVEDSTWAYGAGAVPLKQWTHVAAVFDGTELRMYIDGSLDSTVAATSQGPTSSEDVFIGTLPMNVQNYQGDIAGVRVSTTARYTTAFQPATSWTADASAVLLLRMDEGAGTVAGDSSGLGNAGAILGATWIAECPGPAEG